MSQSKDREQGIFFPMRKLAGYRPLFCSTTSDSSRSGTKRALSEMLRIANQIFLFSNRNTAYLSNAK